MIVDVDAPKREFSPREEFVRLRHDVIVPGPEERIRRQIVERELVLPVTHALRGVGIVVGAREALPVENLEEHSNEIRPEQAVDDE